MAAYDKLSRWAARNRMQFKVEFAPESDGRIYLWMADACDGYCGAECVCILDNEPTWMGYRFRLKKNEHFLAMFMRLGVFRDTNGKWLGHEDAEPLFILPYYWKYEHGTWHGMHGCFYWLDKMPDDGNLWEMQSAGCMMLKSRPEYAPEMVSDVVFVPEDTPHLFHDELYGTEMVGRTTVGRFDAMTTR